MISTQTLEMSATPRPPFCEIANALISQEVIVSGTFVFSSNSPFSLYCLETRC